jgi:hypothetical protein
MVADQLIRIIGQGQQASRSTAERIERRRMDLTGRPLPIRGIIGQMTTNLGLGVKTKENVVLHVPAKGKGERHDDGERGAAPITLI